MFSLHIDAGRDWRGSQRQTMYTVLGLRTAGHRAALVGQPRSPLLQRMSEGLDLIPLDMRRDIDLEAAWRLSRIIKQFAPDVVHAHDLDAAGITATALSIASGEGRPAFVLSQRRDTPLSRQSFSRWTYTQVDAAIASTSIIRDRMCADGLPRDKTHVIYDSVDADRVAHMPVANVHAELFLPTHAPIVGNIGSLIPDKGHRHLVEAAARVVKEVPDARFVVLGDGELRQSLHDQVHHAHLERHVYFAGFRANALELIKGCDLVAIASLREATCTTAMDAMAAAKALVATAVGATPEIVADGETGFLVPPHDDRALATRIALLLRNDTLRRRMEREAARRVRAHFSVERMVDAIAAVYERLVGMRRAAGTANPVAPD
jgi:glycosyltransferase involved in cell wall biosynthesis